MSRIGWERPEDLEVAEEDRGIRGRLFFLRSVIVVALALLLFRVYWLQRTQGEELQTLAEENQLA